MWIKLNNSDCPCTPLQHCYRPIELLEPLICFPDGVDPNNLDGVPTLAQLHFYLLLSLLINVICLVVFAGVSVFYDYNFLM